MVTTDSGRLLETALLVAFLLLPLSPVFGQSAAPATPKFVPPPTEQTLPAGKLDQDYETIRRGPGVSDFRTVGGAKEKEEKWKISKGKEYDKLPPEFQWDTPPEPINHTLPVYPFEQLQNKVTGKVQAFYIVGPSGRVLRIDLGEDTPPELGQAVRAVLDSWNFKPAKKKDGKPCLAYLGVEFNFQPKGRTNVPFTNSAREILRDLEKNPEVFAKPRELDQPLKPVTQVPPVYPSALNEAGPAGSTVIEFFVDEKGAAQLPHILASSAPEFGYSAAQAVADWKFEPPTKAGKAVVVRLRIPFEFPAPAPQPAAKK